MTGIIDRFEGEYAVLEIEGGRHIDLPRALVPDAREGDVIRITVDREETEKRRTHVRELMDQLFED